MIQLGCSRYFSNTFSLLLLDVEESKNCVFDFLTAWSDSPDSSTPIFGPLCGNNMASVTSLQTWTATNASLVVVEFRSDADVSGVGFQLTFAQSR